MKIARRICVIVPHYITTFSKIFNFYLNPRTVCMITKVKMIHDDNLKLLRNVFIIGIINPKIITRFMKNNYVDFGKRIPRQIRIMIRLCSMKIKGIWKKKLRINTIEVKFVTTRINFCRIFGINVKFCKIPRNVFL